MKRFLAIFLVLVMAFALTAVSASADNDEEIVIGFSLMDYSFEFFQNMLGSARKTAEANGVKLIEVDGGSDVQKQVDSLEDLLASYDIDAFFLNPVDADAIGTFTLDANAAGIPVVTVDVRSNEGEVYAHVASSNYDIGALAAEHALKLLNERNGGDKGVVYVVGYPQITSMSDRANGYKDFFANYPDVEVVEANVTDLNVIQAQSLWDDIMVGHPEGTVDVVYGANAQVTTGIISACEAAARTDIDVIGTDDDSAILEALGKNGFVAATVVQSPIDMGKLGVEMCIKAAKGETIDNKEVATELMLVTREGFEDYNKINTENQAAIAEYKD